MASFQNSETREEGSNFGAIIGSLLTHSTLLCVDYFHVLCPLCKKEQPLTILKEKKTVAEFEFDEWLRLEDINCINEYYS